MLSRPIPSSILALCAIMVLPATARDRVPGQSGNPIFEGGYADPEEVVFGDEYRVYPSFSARYEDKPSFDAFHDGAQPIARFAFRDGHDWYLIYGGLRHANVAHPSGNEQRFADLGECPLESGEVIRDCRVGYRTLGTLNADRSNAVLFPTWFGGTSEELLEFVGPQGMVDPEKDFVILVDAFANGVSSSPSNSAGQGGAAFPQVTIRDMVRQQHRLMREVFGLDGLKAVVGISMGGMQAFEWAASYPGFSRSFVPIVGSPRLDPYDVVMWETQLRAAEWFLQCRCSEAAAVSRGVSFLSMGPDYHASASPRDSLASVLRGIAGATQEADATYDRIVQLRAMIGHDAAAGGSLADLARQSGATGDRAHGGAPGFFVVVGRKDHIVTPGPALDFARAAGAETLESDSPCGHAVPWCEAERVNTAVRSFLARF